MANPAHLLRRQSSRDLVHQRSKQKSFDQVELRVSEVSETISPRMLETILRLVFLGTSE